jgi:hypothetical protein
VTGANALSAQGDVNSSPAHPSSPSMAGTQLWVDAPHDTCALDFGSSKNLVGLRHKKLFLQNQLLADRARPRPESH